MTRMPHSPSTTLGMAASSSTSIVMGVRRRRGASLLRNRPIAIDMGTAIKSATSDVTRVPRIRYRAPKTSVTAFQSVDVMKPRPNSWMAGLRLA